MRMNVLPLCNGCGHMPRIALAHQLSLNSSSYLVSFLGGYSADMIPDYSQGLDRGEAQAILGVSDSHSPAESHVLKEVRRFLFTEFSLSLSLSPFYFSARPRWALYTNQHTRKLSTVQKPIHETRT